MQEAQSPKPKLSQTGWFWLERKHVNDASTTACYIGKEYLYEAYQKAFFCDMEGDALFVQNRHCYIANGNCLSSDQEKNCVS